MENPPALAAWKNLLSRRDLLQVGALGIASTLFPRELCRASETSATAGSARSVILISLMGGVTHIDSLDPKPDAPEEIRGTLQTLPTTIPGIRFTEVMPHLARQLGKLTLLRSFSHGSNDHLISQAHMLSGRAVTMAQITSEPNIGSIVSRLHGPRAGFPGYIAVPGTTRPGPPPWNLFVGGWLGRQYAPFCTGTRWLSHRLPYSGS